MIRRLSDSFRLPWQKSRKSRSRYQNPGTKALSSSSCSANPKDLECSEDYEDTLPSSQLPPKPPAIRQYTLQVQAPAAPIEVPINTSQFDDDHTTILPATEIKRLLMSAHRDLEHLQNKMSHERSNEAKKLANEAMQYSWQAYRSMVKLEEVLKVAQSGDGFAIDRKDTTCIADVQDRAGVRRERRQVYIPTGLGSVERPRVTLRHAGDHDIGGEHASTSIQSSDDRAIVAIRKVRGDAKVIVTELPHEYNRKAPPPSLDSLISYHSILVHSPPPRDEVKGRIQIEEASMRVMLNEPDRVRRGSSDGLVIADMMMSGLEDHRFVLPYFHYIKHHEVRALENWLAEANHVTKVAGISRTESLLHCIHILQTGCRYETLAVIFSRSPRQIKESCRGVIQGLLRLHSNTVNETGDQEMYMPLWGIWRKFVITSGRAELYYGFGWVDLAKVLVALNLYIGRWRMQGRFATDGPSFVWGRFFVSQGVVEQVPHLVNEIRR